METNFTLLMMKILKPIKMLFCLLFVTAFTSCGNDHAENPDEMGEEVVAFLVADDADGFKDYVTISEGDYVAFYEEYMRGDEDKLSEDKIKERLAEFEKDVPKIIDRVASAFDVVRKKAIADGVDWSDVEYVESEYEIRNRNGMEMADIYVTLKSNGKKYQIKLDDCKKHEDGWIMLDEMRWRGEKK